MTKSKHLSENEYLGFLKKMSFNDTVEISGQEKQNIWKILQLLEPIEVYNNQRTFTEIYEYQNVKYKVHHGVGDDIILEIIK